MVDVSIHAGSDGVRIITPAGAPTVDDAAAGVDVAALEVAGGYLTWSVLAEHNVPAAVLDDPDTAQDWIWAVYGPATALALGSETTAVVQPGHLADAVYRLAFALWAARWWPASTIDAIPPLPVDLLYDEIGELAELCDAALDETFEAPVTPAPARRAGDYALAASGATTARADVVLARGTAEIDWRTVPPRVLDAAETAATWLLERRDGGNVVRVAAVAAPDLDPVLPAHLWPRALVAGEGAVALELVDDRWTGAAEIARPGRLSVAVEVLGFGTAEGDGRADRDRIREFARRRLAAARADTGEWLLRAEIAAALVDPDF